MGQLLVIVLVPPAVGIAIYALLRLIWNRQEETDRTATEPLIGTIEGEVAGPLAAGGQTRALQEWRL
jgi:hypothetical protein